jgi:hypothetical protein
LGQHQSRGLFGALSKPRGLNIGLRNVYPPV